MVFEYWVLVQNMKPITTSGGIHSGNGFRDSVIDVVLGFIPCTKTHILPWHSSSTPQNYSNKFSRTRNEIFNIQKLEKHFLAREKQDTPCQWKATPSYQRESVPINSFGPNGHFSRWHKCLPRFGPFGRDPFTAGISRRLWKSGSGIFTTTERETIWNE